MKIKDFCKLAMPSEDTTVLGFNKYRKSDKASFIKFVDLDYLIVKFKGCKNNTKISSTTKVGKLILSGF